MRPQSRRWAQEGRKKTPEIISIIRSIVDDDAAGDPMSDRKWTHQTAEKIAGALLEYGIKVSATVVRRLLRQMDYSLKSNKKCLSAGNSSDRDPQFHMIKQLREEFATKGDPIISIDTKKKELIGPFKNLGKTWCKEAKNVNDHDFRSAAIGMAAPYGIYDTERNHGLVVVGQSADTPEFAVNCIIKWWLSYGREYYPDAERLLIMADGGGSNGSRPRAWKKFLQDNLADGFNLSITVAHYPTGASKWNPIEHRMFSEISKNWAGVPLESYDTVVNYAASTKTKTGLCVEACRDQREYQKGIKVSDKQMREISLKENDILGKWNYTISPKAKNIVAERNTVQEASIDIQDFKKERSS